MSNAFKFVGPTNAILARRLVIALQASKSLDPAYSEAIRSIQPQPVHSRPLLRAIAIA